ncbi:MAG: glutamine--tRNA ligase, partial [Actinomycetota bacterium]|nr:glutamine--tRNA ligase [Actinomycetota bacterium]
LAASGERDFSAERYLADGAIADPAQIEPLIDRILFENEAQVAAYRAGKEGLLGFFVGQVMRQTEGNADPKVVNELLRAKLRA